MTIITWTMIIIMSNQVAIEIQTIGFTSKEACVRASKSVFEAYDESFTRSPSTITIRCVIK